MIHPTTTADPVPPIAGANLHVLTKPSDDPLSEFLEDLDALLRRWHGRTSGHWNEDILYSFIDEEPADGCARQRRGPQAKIALTITDTTRPDDLAAARYPDGTSIDWPPVTSLEGHAIAQKR